MDDEVKKATAKGAGVAGVQQNTDGSWSDGRYPHNTAITGFALLAFMSQGHVPNQGKYGQEVAKGAAVPAAPGPRATATWSASRGGNMYCHGMATLALARSSA